MKGSTWNINSVRARLDLVLKFLDAEKPDFLLLQEIKCETAAFPLLAFETIGYKAHVVGQKSYNGVAILSRKPMEIIASALDGADESFGARYAEVRIDDFVVASLYMPNGNPIESEKFTAKLKWMTLLQKRMAFWAKSEHPFILGGDFNVIAESRDVYNATGWDTDALYHPATRASYRRMLAEGYTEAYRACHPFAEKTYSFWDYQAGAWPKNNGLRIDHFLLSPEATDRLIDCHIEPSWRGEEKASDHTPVIIELR